MVSVDIVGVQDDRPVSCSVNPKDRDMKLYAKSVNSLVV